MGEAAKQYEHLLSRARIAFDVDDQPRVFFSAADAWTNCTVRYLVDARRRRRAASDLVTGLSKAMADRRHQGRIIGAYPRSEVRLRRSWRQGDPARDEP
jgi:hypothetical protein